MGMTQLRTKNYVGLAQTAEAREPPQSDRLLGDRLGLTVLAVLLRQYS